MIIVYDAIVCLGRKPVTEEGRKDITARVNLAVSLFKKFKPKYLILSGGYTFSSKTSEAAFMKRIAKRLHIPSSKIILEENSKSTYENAVEVYKLARQLHLRRLAIVTSSYHTLRTAIIFRRVFSPSSRYHIAFFGSNYPLNATLLIRWCRELFQILKAEVLGIR